MHVCLYIYIQILESEFFMSLLEYYERYVGIHVKMLLHNEVLRLLPVLRMILLFFSYLNYVTFKRH